MPKHIGRLFEYLLHVVPNTTICAIIMIEGAVQTPACFVSLRNSVRANCLICKDLLHYIQTVLREI